MEVVVHCGEVVRGALKTVETSSKDPGWNQQLQGTGMGVRDFSDLASIGDQKEWNAWSSHLMHLQRLNETAGWRPWADLAAAVD